MHGQLNVNLSRCTVTWTSIYHDARSPERQFITMHGHLNVNLSRCTVTWTSIYHDARSPERQFITMHGHLKVNLSRCTVKFLDVFRFILKPDCNKRILHESFSAWQRMQLNICGKQRTRTFAFCTFFLCGCNRIFSRILCAIHVFCCSKMPNFLHLFLLHLF